MAYSRDQVYAITGTQYIAALAENTSSVWADAGGDRAVRHRSQGNRNVVEDDAPTGQPGFRHRADAMSCAVTRASLTP